MPLWRSSPRRDLRPPPNKENLLIEIQNRRSVAPMAVDLLDQAGDRPVEDVLYEPGRRFYTQLLSRQKMVRLLVIESGQNASRLSQVSEVPRMIHTNLTAYLAAKMKEGAIRRGDPAVFARAFMSLFFSLVVGRDFLPEETGDTPEDTARGRPLRPAPAFCPSSPACEPSTRRSYRRSCSPRRRDRAARSPQ